MCLKVVIKENDEKYVFPSKNYSALLGIIQVLDRFFVVLTTTVIQVCTIEQSEIYLPITISFLPFDVNVYFKIILKNEKDLQTVSNIVQIQGYITNLRQLLVFGHYFSYSYDLTACRQRRQQGVQLDSRFLWNKHLTKEFKRYKISSSWILPFIQVLNNSR